MRTICSLALSITLLFGCQSPPAPPNKVLIGIVPIPTTPTALHVTITKET